MKVCPVASGTEMLKAIKHNDVQTPLLTIVVELMPFQFSVMI